VLLNAHQCPQDGDSIAEEYALEILSDHDTSVFEEHLLLCGTCRARVVDATQFVCAMKKAAAKLQGSLN
jgi:hypothetical protein